MHFHLSGSHGCIFNDAILAHDILNSSCMHPWGHRSPLCTCLCQNVTVMMAPKQKMTRCAAVPRAAGTSQTLRRLACGEVL